jgi:hypothetical protein
MERKGNQAGPSSAKPETQQGLQETKQLGEEIVKGAHNDDQLDQLQKGEKNKTEENHVINNESE